MSSYDRWHDYAQPHECFGPLVTPEQVLARDSAAGMAHYDSASTKALIAFARYLTEFLPKPHSRLGRKGAVCPYTGGALSRGLIRMSASPLASMDDHLLAEAMNNMRQVFADMGGDDVNSRGDSMYKAIVVLFPLLPPRRATDMVETVQKRLKPAYIREGLMIGEFYPGCPTPGLHNPDFRPLETPVASLAIREITPFDAPFMMDDDLYIAGYLDRYGPEGRDRLMSLLQKAGSCIEAGRSARIAELLKGWAEMNPVDCVGAFGAA